MVEGKITKKEFSVLWIKRYCRLNKIRYKGADIKALETKYKQNIDDEYKSLK